jgi:hypothetical protein
VSPSKPQPKSIYYFCDESALGDEFMAVGGLAVPDTELGRITDRLLTINEERSVFYEVKWNSTKERRDCGQTAYAEELARLLDRGLIHLHVRFAPFREYNHRLSGPRKKVDTTSKMFYQLLLHRAVRHYGGRYKLHIRPDGGNCTSALADQVHALHSDGSQRYHAAQDCIRSIEPRDSEREPLLQLLDVTLGAFTALRNRRTLGEPKRKLAERVHELHGERDLSSNFDSKDDPRRFSIWNARPKW